MQFPTDDPGKLIENLPEALFLEDLNGNILDVNHQACELLGYEKEELLELTVEDLVPEGASAFLPDQIEEATRNGKPLETINVREDGTKIPVELQGRMIEVEGEERMLISIRDISERERLEEDLKTSEKRYRRLFETAQDGMLILDADTGEIIDANPYIIDLLGFSKEELVGKQLWQIGTFQDVAENREKFQKLVKEGYIRYENLPLETKSGEEASVEFVSNTYEVNGQRVVQCNIRDITERKRTERKLKQSQERLELAIEGGDLGTWDWNVITDEVRFNEQWAEMLGYDKKELELCFSTWENLVHPDDLPEVQEKLDEHLEGKTDGYEAEFRMKHKNGNWVWVQAKGRVIKRDEEGNPVRACGTHLDITERKQAKKKYRIVTEGASQAIYLFQDGKFKFVNEGFEKLSGYSEEELHDTDFPQLVHPDYREKVTEWTRQALSGEDSELPDKVEYKALKKDGEAIWVRSLPSLIEYKRKPAIVANAVDITEEKKLQKELRSEKNLMESIMTLAPDLVYFKNDNHRFERVNEKYTELLGLEEEEMIGKTAEDFWPEAEEIMEDERRALSGEPVIDRERKVTLPDGEKRWYSINKLPRRDGDGNVVGFLGMDRDITRRKRAEKKLQESQRKLKESKERYQSYFEQLGDAVYITKVGGEDHGLILDANQTAEEQTGYSLEELIGMNIEEDIAAEEPETIDHETGDKKLRQGETITFIEQKRRGDGTEYWTEVLVTPIEYKGEEACLSINRDITERKQAKQALNDERNKLKKLHDAVDELQRQDTEKAMLRTAVDVAERMLDFEICAISTLEGDYLVPKANSSDLDPEETASFKVGEGIAGKTIQRGETIWGDDLRNYPEAKPTNEDFKAFISAPIGDLGTVQVISEEVGSFTERDVELAEILAGHLREELDRVRLEEELRQQAIRDPLTDLYNRRYFNETLQKEVKRADRYDKPLAFLMIDVNRFKEINDRYSHQTGDEVLKQVANLLEDNVRDADTVVRYGGDEFLVMMPQTNGGVTSTVNRLKKELDGWNEQTDLLDFTLTLAMGVSHWSPDQDRDVEEALNEADKKMYEDKRG